MAPASSPIAFPTSPVAGIKRPSPGDTPKPTEPRIAAGFVVDDDSDSDDDAEKPLPKKRMLLDTRIEETQALFEAPSISQDGITTPPDSQPADDAAEARDNAILGLDDAEASSQSIHAAELHDKPAEQTDRPRLFGGSSIFSRLGSSASSGSYKLATCSGKTISIKQRKPTVAVSYENMVSARSKTKEGRAKRAYYGIEVHELVDAAAKEIAAHKLEAAKAPATPPTNPQQPLESVEEDSVALQKGKKRKSLLWTEKYRARTFMDLVGDDMTNRHVLRWLKRWDQIVFPHAAKSRPGIVRKPGQQQHQQEEEKPHRKILMLTGPPGLGKTTLAHVCARQAGYEVMEINASDDRSRDVVRGRIRTSLGTESVKTVEQSKTQLPGQKPKVAKPLCVVVDEVDGVVSGSGGSGEGGFVRALIDLVLMDQKNAAGTGESSRKKKKGDDFRQMRPLILICNDVYHPSLRPLRQSGLAEIIHVGKPSIDAVVTRLKTVFEKEGIPCEKDAARKLCESAWGMTSGIDAKRGAESNAEGDLRGIMVVGEWVAGRLRATTLGANLQLTRQWVEQNVVRDLAHGGGGARGLGRGGTKEIVNRIFQLGAGFPKQAMSMGPQVKHTLHEQPQAQLAFSEQLKKYAMGRLREMVDTSGEVDRIMTEIFSEYPNREFNDDSYLSKPDAAYEWMHFHDTCSSRLFSNQDWELAPYLSQPVLACHHLFASATRYQPNTNHERKWGDAEDDAEAAPLPFSGPRADFLAHEAEKVNRAVLQNIQAQLPPTLMRSFRSPEHVATDFLPYLVRLVSPDVKPVLVGGSGDQASVASVRREAEKNMVKRAAHVLAEVGIALQKGKIESDAGAGPVGRTQWVYRMDPDLDALATYETAGALVLSTQAPTRYAVRQVLDQELRKTIAMRETAARQARFKAGNGSGIHEDFAFDDKENAGKKDARKETDFGPIVKKDFFGRIIVDQPLQDTDGNAGKRQKGQPDTTKVWVTFHEGLNNAVKKPVTLEEFLSCL